MSKKKRAPIAKPYQTETSKSSASVLTPAEAVPEGSQAPGQVFLKKWFFGSLVLMLGILWFSGFNVGYHSDEIYMNNYCKTNCAFYASAGKDSSYLMAETNDGAKTASVMRFYGSSFEYLPVGFNKIFGIMGGPNEYNVRHAFIQLFAALALLFAGLIARKASGWRAALFTIWLLFLTPTFFGSSLMNSKDIPFCTGYMASLYFIICFLEELPKPGWKSTLLLMLSFAFITGERIGGLLIIIYLAMFIAIYAFTNKELYRGLIKNAGPLLLKLILIGAGGMALVVISWPYLLGDPIAHIIETFTVVKKFPNKVILPFEGVFMDSLTIPIYYLPKMMGITIPIFILMVIVWGIISVISNYAKYNFKIILLLLFTSIFPVVYAIVSQVSIYSSWRHFLFIYPGLCIVGGLGLNSLVDGLKKPAFKIAFVGLCVLGMIRPVVWMIKNHPYEYYFNEFPGGYKAAYYNYETDYWQITAAPAAKWMMEHEHILSSKDTVVIATDMSIFLREYLRTNYPKAKVKINYTEDFYRFRIPWTYGLFSNLFLAPELLEKFYPPSKSIYAEKIDGLPLTVVVKDTERLDLKGMNALQSNNFVLADSLISLYLKKDGPDNVGLYSMMSFIKASLQQNDAAIKYGEDCIGYNLGGFYNYISLCGMGLAYANLKKYDIAIQKVNQALEVCKDDPILPLMPEASVAPNLLKVVTEMQQKDGGK